MVLGWSPGKDALSHDVYLGNDYNDVNDATPDSNEYKGNYQENSYDPCGLDFVTTYYWRIDEVADSNTYKGDVWSFKTYLEPNLISWWKFDEGQGTIAYDSAGSNHGNVYGATWTAGQINGALSFDGVDDYVEIPDSDDFDFGTRDFSISVWFKTSNSMRDQYIIDFYGPSNTPHIEIYTSYGNLGTHIMPGDKRIRDGGVADDEWHHSAITLDNGESYGYQLYLDGVNVGKTTYSGFLADWETISIATRDLGYPNKPFDGKIDEVMIYNRVLSAGEIQQLYHNGSAGL